MAKNLAHIVIISMCLLIVEFSGAQEDSPLPPSTSTPTPKSPSSPSTSPSKSHGPAPVSAPSKSPGRAPVSAPSRSPGQAPVSAPSTSPEQAPISDLSTSPGQAPVPNPFDDDADDGEVPVPAPSDDDADDDDTETEYLPPPTPSPAPDIGKPEDLKASEDGEFNDEGGDNNGLSAWEKAGIAIGTILGVGAIVIGALVYKKRRDNMNRARYTYFTQGEFL